MKPYKCDMLFLLDCACTFYTEILGKCIYFYHILNFLIVLVNLKYIHENKDFGCTCVVSRPARKISGLTT